ncbi:MAG: hypothetical protein ABEK01_00425 [Candidatus Nanohaloarchaea archaeon]
MDNGFTVSVNPASPHTGNYDADLILVTGEEALEREKIGEISGKRSCVVLPGSSSEEAVDCRDVELIHEGETIDIFGIEIESVPRGKGTGYRFVMRDTSFYVADSIGSWDTPLEFENEVNFAFVPLGDPENRDVGEAVRTVVGLKPDLAVPYQYNTGDTAPAERFRNEIEARSIRCEIIEPES